MTAFNISQHMRYAEDPAMTNCAGPILYDASSTQEMLIQYQPMQGAQQYAGIGPACYNGITELKFIVQADLGSRVRFDKSYIKLEYTAADISVPAPYQQVDVSRVSVPWNPIAATVQSVYYQLNGTNQTVERYDAQFQHGNMIKLLTSYTRPALEEAHDRFFTPCIESTRDVLATLSPESAERSKRAFRRDTDTSPPQQGSKIIMLADVFDSMKAEVASFVQLFQLYITLKAPDAILFQTGAAPGVNRFYVTGLRLFIVTDRLSEAQLSLETERITENLPIVRCGYRRFDVFTDLHASTKSYITTGIKNLQASVLLFPSTTCGDAIGINPYQYTYASGPTLDSGITFYRHRYGAITYPISGQTVDPINKSRNTEMFSHWRTLTRTINDRTFSPAVPFLPCVGLHGATYDVSTYVFFAAVFCNQDTAPMKVASGYDHEIIVNGGVSGAIGVIVRIRLNAFAIGGDTSVTIMD